MIRQRLESLIARLRPGQLGRNKIVLDTSAILTSNWVGQALAMVTSILLARTLGRDDYGLIIIAIALVSTIVRFLDIHTHEGTVKFMAAALAEDDRPRAVTFFYVALTTDVALMAATMLALVILVPQLVPLYDQPQTLRAMASIYMLSVPFTTLETTFAALPVIFKRFRAYSAIMILNQVVLLGAAAALVWQGPVAVMWAYVVAAAVSFAAWVGLGVWLLRANFADFRVGDYRGALREFVPFAFHTTITESLKTIFIHVDVLVLGALRPAGEVALYRIAMSATSLSALFVNPLRPVLYPELTEAWAKRAIQRIRRLLSLWTLYGTLISLASLVGFLLLARWLLRVLYGAEYVPAAGLITILMVGYLFSNAFLWLRPLTLGAGRPQVLTFVTLLTSILRVGLAFPLIWVYGAVGAAYAFVITMAVYGLVAVFYALPKLGVWNPWRPFRPQGEG